MQGRYKSRTFRRTKKTTPGARKIQHYTKRKPKKQVCANCCSILSGIPRLNDTAMRNLAKTKKRPERPYGGVLCTTCMRAEMIKKARQIQL